MTLEERIVQNAGDAIIAADASGNITLWNSGAERLFGYTATEALTQSLDIIIPGKFRKRHWIGYQHVMETGLTRYGTRLLRVPALRKDGSQFSIAFTVGLLKESDGPVQGIFAILRDDSERWDTEQALRKQIDQLKGA